MNSNSLCGNRISQFGADSGLHEMNCCSISAIYKFIQDLVHCMLLLLVVALFYVLLLVCVYTLPSPSISSSLEPKCVSSLEGLSLVLGVARFQMYYAVDQLSVLHCVN